MYRTNKFFCDIIYLSLRQYQTGHKDQIDWLVAYEGRLKDLTNTGEIYAKIQSTLLSKCLGICDC